MLWLQKIKKDDLCWEVRDVLGEGLFAVWEGRVCLDAGMGEEEGEIGERREATWWYIKVYRWNHQWKYSVGDCIDNSAGEGDTSLYEDPGLNPSAISSVKSPIKTSTSLHYFVLLCFSKFFILHLGFYWYIPTE
jgi:hypothetical protein